MKKVVGDFATEVSMPSEEATDICNLAKGDKCCAFLVMSGVGFECIRLSYPRNGSIFRRLEDGTMNAKGEGGWIGCAWEGEI